MGFRTDNAVVVPWAATYLFNRKSPCQRATDVTPVVPINGDGLAPEPSYPSEHGAIAGTGVSSLTVFFPMEKAHLKAMAAEGGRRGCGWAPITAATSRLVRPRPGRGPEGPRPSRHRAQFHVELSGPISCFP
jgi:membrane-associated phospholipid phosphatase